MQRRRLIVALLLAAAVGIAAGCGGEEVSPTPETVEGTVPQSTAPAATTEGGGAVSEGDPVAGKTVFVDFCGVCHTLSDAGTSGAVGPNLDGLALDFDAVHQQVVNGGGGMPAFGDQLDEQQLNDVSAYVVQASAG